MYVYTMSLTKIIHQKSARRERRRARAVPNLRMRSIEPMLRR
jgi:hypothetical protein